MSVGPKIGGAVEKGLAAHGVKVFRSAADLANYVVPKGVGTNLRVTPVSVAPAAGQTQTTTP